MGITRLQDYWHHLDFQGILSTVIHPKTLILFLMYYKNRARYRGKDTKASTPFLMQVLINKETFGTCEHQGWTDTIFCKQDSREGTSEWFAHGDYMEQ